MMNLLMKYAHLQHLSSTILKFIENYPECIVEELMLLIFFGKLSLVFQIGSVVFLRKINKS